MSYKKATLSGKQIYNHSPATFPFYEVDLPVRMPMATLADEIFSSNEDKLSGDSGSMEIERNPDKFTKYYTGQQLELNLEDPRDILHRYKLCIKKYEKAHEKLALYALNWHYLMEDIKDDEVLMKMFNDINLLRKLSGGTIL